ncbi:ABC transporter ATP-binding protein [Thermoproteota archaeon]
MPIIKTINLSKEFKRFAFSGIKKVAALDALNLSIDRGEIFAFLGPNGAGKTTTLSMLAGFVVPSNGRIELFGKNFSHRDIDVKNRIGYLPESPHLPDYYRVCELLEFYCDIFFIPRNKRKDTIGKLLEEVGLHKQEHEWIKSLSMGQKRCLGLAVALINDPEIIFLDEPTVYLDPVVLEKIRKVLLKLKERGSTIFMSSHILSEVERISDRFAIIKEGRLLEEGTTVELIKHRSLEEEFLKMMKDNE